MADLRDEQGNPVQLTDEFGNPVQLTDEHGNPMHITGLATSEPLHISSVERTEVVEPLPPLLVPPSSSPTIGSQTTDHGSIADTVTGASTDTIPPSSTEIKRDQPEHTTIGDALTNKQDVASKEMDQTSSSSSGSSEDDGRGGRRKKKGLKQKIKEKLTGGDKHKEDRPYGTHMTTTTTTTGAVGEHHEKKSVLEKIKEKLPGHH